MNYKLIKRLIIIAIIICLIVFIAMTDFNLVINQIRSIGLGFLFVLLFSLGGHIFGSLAWQYCFPNPKKVSFWQLFSVRIIGENITLLNPTNIIAGEASKYQLLKNVNLSKQTKIESIIISRFLLISSQFVIALLCIAWLARNHNAWAMIAAGTLSLVLICTLSFFILERSLMRVSVAFPTLHNWILKAFTFIRQARSFVQQHPRQVAIVCALSTIHWICGAGEIYIILSKLSQHTNLLDCLAIDTGVVIIKSLGGFVPGQIGIEEGANKWMLMLTGISSATLWVTVSIIRRGKQLFWIAISALLYFTREIPFITKKNIHGDSICNA